MNIKPDIIVHERRVRNNYLVIEAKKRDCMDDYDKLKGLKQKQGYDHALFIYLAEERSKVKIQEIGVGGPINDSWYPFQNSIQF